MSVTMMRRLQFGITLHSLIHTYPGRALLSLPLVLLATGTVLAPPNRERVPDVAGTLVVCGGGKLPEAVHDRFIELAGGPRARIVIIPTASPSVNTENADRWLLPWKRRKVASLVVLHTRSRRQADDPAFLKPLSEATGVWISGGDQRLLTKAYLGTAVLGEIKKVLDRDGVVGGTSAGAAVMSRVMIAGGQQRPELDRGFGLLSQVIVDQHFRQRKRDRRLLAAVSENPELVGLGVDEETAVVIRGRVMKVLGNFAAVTCLAPAPGEPASVQVLEGGAQADLIALTQAARERAQPDNAER